jgi:hypothetical protein
MTKRVVRFICVLSMAIASIVIVSGPASATEAYTCDQASASHGVYTYGDTGQKRWGWATTVHSTGCNHWGNVALHAPLPSGYQVNVTLWRHNADYSVSDHRYCYVYAGGSNCHTPAILTTSCIWSYSTFVDIYIWNGSTWALVAWNPGWSETQSC